VASHVIGLTAPDALALKKSYEKSPRRHVADRTR
jgi:hypothetical protein